MTKEDMWAEIIDFFNTHALAFHDCNVPEKELDRLLGNKRKYIFSEIKELYHWVFHDLLRAVNLYNNTIKFNDDIAVARMFLLQIWKVRPRSI